MAGIADQKTSAQKKRTLHSSLPDAML